MQKALREATGLGTEESAAVLSAAEIDAEVRPENVDVAGFVRLFAELPDPSRFRQ